MPGVTLFDVAHLFETEPPSPGAAGASPPSEPPAPDALERKPQTPDEAHAASGRDGASPAVAAPAVEVRISKRRKKTSEAKWVGGRIVVSLPAHLDVESRQKTIDWLVERLLTRHRLQSGLDDAGLLARAIELSDRYLVGARPDVGPLGHQPDGALGLVLVLLGPHPPLTPSARRARLGARLRAGARGRASDPPGPLPRLPQAGRRLPAPRGGGRLPGRVRPGPLEPQSRRALRTERRSDEGEPDLPLRPARPPGSAPAGAGSRSPHRA